MTGQRAAGAEAVATSAADGRGVGLRPAAPPDDEVLALLAVWLPGQRWYPLAGADGVRIAPERSYVLDRGVFVHLLRLTTPETSLVVQVPVVVLHHCGRPSGPAVIGSAAGGTAHFLDGTAHPRYWRALLRAAHWDGDPVGDVDVGDGRLVTGEQSNSSVILPRAGGGVIAKVLRIVSEGPNPDLTVPLALTKAGWDGVPAPRAWLPLDGESPEGTLLAVVADLVPGAADGFELACATAGRGEPFEGPAAALGATVAGMHTALASALPGDGPLDAAWLLADLRARADRACDDSATLASRRPGLARFHDRLADVVHRADPADLPRLQAIHGDLHLGQALSSESGWRILDFEGEPLRPAAERARPDLALRDVAGVLRSLDYAAAVGGADDPGWADRAGAAFLDSYRSRAGSPAAADELLAALTLDKALYEVVYDELHRPSWAPIPLAAVDRLLARP